MNQLSDNSLILESSECIQNAFKDKKLQIALASPTARAPTRATPGSAGYDLYADEDTVIPAGSRGLVSAGFKLAIPPTYYARIAPRSGLSLKHCIDVGAGVVDSDYRNVVKVLLINHGREDFQVNVGDRIAQMILEHIMTPTWQLVSEEELNATERGEGGFGSTGM